MPYIKTYEVSERFTVPAKARQKPNVFKNSELDQAYKLALSLKDQGKDVSMIGLDSFGSFVKTIII